MGEPQHWFTRAFRDRATEEAYREETARRIQRSYRIASVLVLVIYVLFHQLESRVTNQVTWLGSEGNVQTLLWLRKSLGLPLAAAATLFGWAPMPLFRRHWPKAWLAAVAGVVVAPFLSVQWMPQPQLVNLGIAGLSLAAALLAGCLVFPARFINVLGLALVTLVVTGLNARGPFHGMRDLVPVYFWFYFALWLALFCAYQIEAGDRRAFLQGRAFEKERARADVAERSRAMSEALLRMAGAPRVPTRVQPGDVIDSRYRVIQLLGAGGMGQVHEVERTIDGRRLALKILTGPTDREALLRFAREAQVAAEIVHPNVVSVFDVGVAQSGMFLVMELVAGSALSANKDRYGDAAWARPILKQVASALSAMHARGIVHRDLKPANVLLDGDRAKVADFGIASLGEPGGSDSTVTKGAPLTEAGVIMGTPLYMAPELEHGARGATPPADLYSLGVMAYELLSRKLPHATAPVLERLAGRVPPKAPSLGEARPDLPAPLIALIDRCLAFSPEARPTAAEVSEAL